MRPRWLGVNPVRGESELAPLPPDAYKDVFGSENVARVPFDRLTDQFTRRRELFGLLAVLLFVAFIAEASYGARQALRKGGTENE